MKLELKFCIFIQKGKSRKMKITEIKAERLNKVSYTVKLSGSDGLGRWTGDGVFTIKDGVPFFWMLKKYAEKKRAGQTGKYKDLVFMSESISQSRLNGEWYYDGFEYSTTHSGTWSIDADAAPEMKFDL